MGYSLMLLLPILSLVGICILKNMFRSTARSLTSLILVALAALLAVPLVAGVADRTADTVCSLILENTAESGETYGALLAADLPLAEPTVRALLSSAMALLLFPLVFVVARLLLCLISLPIRRLLPDGLMDRGRSKWMAALLGLVCGLLIAVLCFSPALTLVRGFSAGVGTAEKRTADVASAGENDTLRSLYDFRDKALLPLEANPVSPLLSGAGRPFCSLLGRRPVKDTEGCGNAATDIAPWTEAVFCTEMLTAEDSETLAAGLEALADATDRSDSLAALCAQATFRLSKAWLAGESYLGISAPGDGALGKMAREMLLSDFDDVTPETVGEHLRRLAESLRNLEEIEQDPSGAGLEMILKRLADGAGEEGVLKDAVLTGMIEAARAVGAEELCRAIGEQTGEMPDAEAQAHLQDWLTNLPDTAGDEAAMTAELIRLGDDFGFTLEEETARLAAECLARLYYGD